MTDITYMTKELKYCLKHDLLEFISNIDLQLEIIKKATQEIEHKKNEEVEELLSEYIKLRQYSHYEMVQNIEYVLHQNGSEAFIDKVHDMSIIEVSAPKHIWKEDKEKFYTYLDSKFYVTKGF